MVQQRDEGSPLRRREMWGLISHRGCVMSLEKGARTLYPDGSGL